jgi:hypothetical protein
MTVSRDRPAEWNAGVRNDLVVRGKGEAVDAVQQLAEALTHMGIEPDANMKPAWDLLNALAKDPAFADAIVKGSTSGTRTVETYKKMYVPEGPGAGTGS